MKLNKLKKCIDDQYLTRIPADSSSCDSTEHPRTANWFSWFGTHAHNSQTAPSIQGKYFYIVKRKNID